MAVGNGVLAKAESANVVFCQLVPWAFDFGKQYNLKRTYRRASFVVARLLAGMGDSMPSERRAGHATLDERGLPQNLGRPRTTHYGLGGILLYRTPWRA